MNTSSRAFQEYQKENPYPLSFFSFRMEGDPPVEDKEERYYSRKGYAARLVHATLRKSGFVETETLLKGNLIYGGPLDSTTYAKLKPYQRLTHYNKTFSLGSKSGYHHVMTNFAERTGSFPSFYPQSFLLPNEWEQLEKAFPTSELWISKPGGGARGEGIHVIRDLPKKSSKCIIQRYISNPMLINGLKFDLRFYVAVTSLDPLQIYIHKNGLVRLATEKYEENVEDIDNVSAHLTNFSINRHNPLFKATDDLSEDGKGNKWTHNPFWPYLDEHGYDSNKVRSQIEDAIVTVLIASRETFMSQNNHRLSFEMFGFDVMLDSDGNPYVLEVNVTPALGTSSKLDMYVKAPVVRDLFNIGMIPKPSEAVPTVHDLITKFEPENAAEIAVIYEYEITLQRCGDFRCVFPVRERIESHGSLLKQPTKADIALQKWILMSEDEKSQYLQENGKYFQEILE
ncbi:Tubulin-tyrosine ligase family protein [Histomonas meleagridis]|uniref:Tubulin-tyrosine ligase family protein n=1 Tax=Histomonas meleagridis TaxID=135588 RepID=UPI00355A8148|nr:Tubulin-tyrosine ligase family protein [Histomonas meleagridis]KAH0806124.1 Tubulin-tyrosine ligase family protein [Histomonas meleagridis]